MPLTKMITVFHSRYGDKTPLKGQAYLGSDREKLSEFMGGLVGFAYSYLPECWATEVDDAIIEVHLSDDCPIVLSLYGDGIPNIDYFDTTRKPWKLTHLFEDELLNGNYYIGKAKDLETVKGTGELVFLAEKATFGDFVTNRIGELLCSF